MLGKNLHLVDCATVCVKSEAMLTEMQTAAVEFCLILAEFQSYRSKFLPLFLLGKSHIQPPICDPNQVIGHV